MKSRHWLSHALAFFIATVSWTIAVPASGQIFVANSGNGTVGEYSFSGAPINASLISGLNDPEGIAISGDDLFVVSHNVIGEYTTSGTPVNPTLITDGLVFPVGIAISGGNVFVTNWGSSGIGWIGEYTTSGDTVNAQLIPNLGSMAYPSGIAIDSDQLFVSGYAGLVGLYGASGATINQKLIHNPTDLTDPTAIAIAGGNLFVTNSYFPSIWQYTTSGVLVPFWSY